MYIPLDGILVWLLIVNAAGAIMTFVDKKRARRHGRRIPEIALMLVAALGGAAAMLLVMCVIKHKTRHLKFMLGLPIMLVLHCALAVYLWRYCSFIYIVY